MREESPAVHGRPGLGQWRGSLCAERRDHKVLRSVKGLCHKRNIFRLVLREFILAASQGTV